MWERHRRRAEVLRERYPFAQDVLTVYLALIDVWQQSEHERPELMLPAVVKAVEATAPLPLATATRELVESGDAAEALDRWASGQDLAPVEMFVARACLRPWLALNESTVDTAAADERHCPRCGGLPQLSFRAAAGDPLVNAERQLMCSRCGNAWKYSVSSCAYCGETTGSQRTLFAEDLTDQVFPHLRIDSCATCRRYLIDVNLGRDAQALPEVDELTALPLDLYAADNGLSKVIPNLMGF